ncbi:MAG: MBL fold metallo-hydrolase, partial [FCB group bacterium]|nr:MBL fold metallo-hydrolase [FCB group bacterium]
MLETIGKWKITALEAGRFSLDGGAMMGSVPKVLWEKTNPPDAQNRIRLAMRCLLLDDGEQLVLIESGMGTKIGDSFKTMFDVKQTPEPLENALNALGRSLEDITHVLVTHLHFDHAGGLTKTAKNGKLVPTFRNARYFISRRN